MDDLATIDTLAHLQLVARRLGLELTLARAPRDLLELVALAGLDAVLGVEPARQAEEGEERVGLEEEGELDDPSA